MDRPFFVFSVPATIIPVVDRNGAVIRMLDNVGRSAHARMSEEEATRVWHTLRLKM